jgi:hypothetical protein
VTGALAAGAVTTGIVALADTSTLRDDRTSRPTSGAELDSLSSRARAFALVSDLCTAGAVIAGGLSIYFTLRAVEPRPREGVRVGVGPGTASVWYRF